MSPLFRERRLELLHRRDQALALLLTFVFDDDGRTLGDVLIDRQIADLRDVLDESAERFHLQLKPRGAGKSDLVGAAMLAIALVQAPSDARMYVASADRDQSRLVVDSMRSYVRRTPLLRQEFDVRAYEVECRRNGVVIEALAADTAGSAGLRPYVLVLDELFQWEAVQRRVQAFYEFLVTSVPKVEGARIVAISTAPHPDHGFAPLVEQARTDALWKLSWWTAVDGLAPAPWQRADEIQSIRASLSEGAYRRLYLNEMVAGSDEPLGTPAQLRGLFRPSVVPPRVSGRVRYALGLDLSVTGDKSAAAVAHLEQGEGGSQVVVVDRLLVWSPTKAAPLSQDRVLSELLGLDELYAFTVNADAYQSLGLLERLRRHGVLTDVFNYTPKSKSRLGAMDLTLVREGRWSLPPDPDLVADLNEATVVDRPDGSFFVQVPRSSRGHGDALSAVELASEWLLTNQPRVARSGGNWLGGAGGWDRGAGTRDLPDEGSPHRFGGLTEQEYRRTRLDARHAGGGDPRLAGRR
ncbi:terminase large subunit [Nocardioides sp.]|uniref:terminase large subunit domain-containing protein n=1 Tax=Nocardioides sp. TaxID=35761 RepID=UPI00262F77A7|nr:terminase large subunit [Nocardioides sp.]MCW2735453.1 terminase [Nocardioides sp.]